MRLRTRLTKHLAMTLILACMTVGFTTTAERQGPLRRFLLQRVEQRMTQKPVDAVRRELPFGGRVRRYYVHQPADWDRTSRLPVVFLFHGGGGSARQALDHYQLMAKADAAGFLLVAPNGVGPTAEALLTWNVGFGFGEAQKRRTDDVGFVNAILAALKAEWPIDSDRIYATGMSNGAFLCHHLAAQPGTPFAAIAPVVGSLGGRELGKTDWHLPPRPSAPVAVLAIQGLLDEHVPIRGGRQKKSLGEPKEMTSASQTIDFWVRANGCATEPQTLYDAQKQASWFHYAHPEHRAAVEVWVLHNQGHAWPGAKVTPRKQSDPPSPAFIANDVIWDFFSRHPRRR